MKLQSLLAIVIVGALALSAASSENYTTPINDSRQATVTILVQAQNVIVYRRAQAFKPVIQVTSCSIANPTVVTAPAHSLITGDVVTLAGTTCTPTINGSRTVTVTGVNTFTVPVSVSSAGAGGGTVQRTTSSLTLSSPQADVCTVLQVPGGASCTAAQAIAADARIYAQSTAGREQFWNNKLLLNAFPDVDQLTQQAARYLWQDWYANVAGQAAKDAECTNAGITPPCDLSK